MFQRCCCRSVRRWLDKRLRIEGIHIHIHTKKIRSFLKTDRVNNKGDVMLSAEIM